MRHPQVKSGSFKVFIQMFGLLLGVIFGGYIGVRLTGILDRPSPSNQDKSFDCDKFCK